jgi:hypothetical protein
MSRTNHATGGQHVGTAGGNLLRGGRFLPSVFAAMGSVFDRERYSATRAGARPVRQRNHYDFADAAWFAIQISEKFL